MSRSAPIALAVAFLSVAPSLVVARDESASASATALLPGGVSTATPTSSAGFVENCGQWDPAVRFVTRSPSLTAFFTERQIALHLTPPEGETACAPTDGGDHRSAAARVHFTFEGSEASDVQGVQPSGTRIHSFVGADRTRWRSDVPVHAAVRYTRLYGGVDLEVHRRRGLLEYDLHLERAADVSRIVVRCDGVLDIWIEEDGSLVALTGLGPLRQRPPQTFAVSDDGRHRPVECRYRILDSVRFGFELPDREPDERIVIDPGIEWSTFVGGALGDQCERLAIDPSTGDVFLAGHTDSLDFPATATAFDDSANGARDAFVCRLSADGSTLLWATYLGSPGSDQARDVKLASNGEPIVVGFTDDVGFPTTAGAFDTTSGGRGFVTRLTASGDALVWSSFMPGGRVRAVDVAASGDVVVAGAASIGLPATVGAFDTTHNGGGNDAFVARFLSDGSDLAWATFLGGSCPTSFEGAYDVALAASGEVTVTGLTCSSDFPTTTGAFQETYGGGPSDGFVTKLAADGTALVTSTFVGGDDFELVNAVSQDASGVVTIAGETESSDYPTTTGAYDETYASTGDAFVTRLSSDGQTLVFSTYLGGNSNDHAHALDVATDGTTTVTGSASSTDFPTTPGAHDDTRNATEDCFVARLDATGTSLLYSSYVGGLDRTSCHDLELLDPTTAIIAGPTRAPDYPTTASSFQPFHGGDWDAYAGRIELTPCPGSFLEFGAGCPGLGGATPLLEGTGCPTGGSTVWWPIRYSSNTGMTAFLFFGLGQDPVQIKPGCFLEIGPLLPLVLSFPVAPAPLGGTVPLALPLDAGVGAGDLYLQVMFADPEAAAFGVSGTNALKMTIVP